MDKQTIHFENRAWKGTRLHNKQRISSTKPHRENEDLHLPVWLDFCILKGCNANSDKFYLEQNHTYKRDNACYGGYVFTGRSVKECFKWIEDNYNVECVCDDKEIKDGTENGII